MFFFFKQKTAYEMRISDWSSDVCSSDLPSLLTWPGSCIVHDIKGENWGLTAGLRAGFGRVLLFDPTNTASAAYNPLLEVRRGEWEVRDVQNVADVLEIGRASCRERVCQYV